MKLTMVFQARIPILIGLAIAMPASAQFGDGTQTTALGAGRMVRGTVMAASPDHLTVKTEASPTKPVRGATVNPLVRDGQEYIPNIPHVFRQDQHLYFLYEAYDPAHRKSNAPLPATGLGLERRAPIGGVRVLTSIEFILNGTKVYETPQVEATAINSPDRGAVAFQFDVPLSDLKLGTYICQVTVVDDAGGTFSFPRMAFRITPRLTSAATPVGAATAPGPM